MEVIVQLVFVKDTRKAPIPNQSAGFSRLITDPHIVSKQLDPLVPVTGIDLFAVCLLKKVESLVGDLKDFIEHLLAG